MCWRTRMLESLRTTLSCKSVFFGTLSGSIVCASTGQYARRSRRSSKHECRHASYTLVASSLFSTLLPLSKSVTALRHSPSSGKEFITREVDKLLADGIIEKNFSPWRSQVVIEVPENHRKRLVIDLPNTSNGGFIENGFEVPCVQYLWLSTR